MIFERKIRQARLWMRASALAEAVTAAAAAGAAVVLGAVLAAKIALPGVPWGWVAAGAGGAAFATAVAWYARQRPTLSQAALRLDEVHGLKERFVTALHAVRGDHPFRDAIVADAERAATGVVARRAGRAPTRGPAVAASVLACFAALAFFLMPEFDLLGRKGAAAAKAAAKQTVAQEAKKLDQLQKRMTEAPKGAVPMEAVDKAAKEIAELQKQFSQEHAPAARDAMAKLSSVAERIAKDKERLRDQSRAEVKRAERAPGDQAGPTSRLERALRRGDLEGAKAELARLREQAGQPGQSREDQKKTGEELAKLGGRIDGQEGLSAALAEAGSSMEKGDAASAKGALDTAKASLDGLARAQEEMRKLDEALSQIEKSKSELANAVNGESAMSDGAAACSQCQGKGCDSCKGKSGGEGDTGKGGSGKDKKGEPGRRGEEGSEGDKFGVGGGKSGGAGQAGEAGAGECEGSGQAGSEKSGGTKGEGSGSGQKATAGTGGGTGKGSASGSGQGSGPDWGVGSTNLATEKGYDAAAKAGSNRYAAGRNSDWTEQFVQLYAARKTDTKQYNTRAKGQMGEGKFDYSVDVQGEARREAANAGVTRAFLDYRDAQKDALSKEDIPVGYKNYVKSYFDSIEPPK